MNCKIIQDLLPLYHDEVVSKESSEQVEEHLRTCAECRKKLEVMHETIRAKNVPNMEQPMISDFKSLKKVLRRKTIIKIAISVICAIATVSALVYGVFFYETPVSYSELTRTITQPVDSALDLITNVGNHNSVALFQKGDTLYICCSDTFWTRYIARPSRSVSLKIPVAPTAPHISNDPDIPGVPDLPEPPEPPDPFVEIGQATRIFYIEGRLSEFSYDDAAFSKAAANAVLLWEKQ